MRIYKSLPEANRNILGNMLYTNNSIYWELPISNSTILVLFEKQLLSILANVLYKIHNINAIINDNEVYLNIPDDEGIIVKPYTLILKSKNLYVDHNSCGGEIELIDNNFIKNVISSNPDYNKKFIDLCLKEFYSVLLSLKKREFEI